MSHVKETVLLDGENLTLDTLMELGTGTYTIGLVPSAWQRVDNSRKVAPVHLSS
jgi:hypothetical protein